MRAVGYMIEAKLSKGWEIVKETTDPDYALETFHFQVEASKRTNGEQVRLTVEFAE